MNWDLTGKATSNFIMTGAGTGGSVAERLGISWNDSARKKNLLDQEAVQRENMTFRHHAVETRRADQVDDKHEAVTGTRRNLTAGTGFNPGQRQNFAQFAAMSGRIAA